MEFYIIFFLVGFIASFIGSIAGGGGLISIPLLIFLGLPPQVAVATNKLGSIGLAIGTVAKFLQTKHILWNHVVPLSLIGVAGGYVGSNILLSIDQEILSKIIGVIILALLPFLLFKKDLGVITKEPTKVKRFFGYIAYFLIMIYGGFFGGGGGTFVLYAFIMLFGLTFIEASATSGIPWFFMS